MAPSEAIGGHFSAIVEGGRNSPPGRHFYESARSCLYALLRVTGARRIHVPNYICDAILDATNAAGVTAVAYQINSSFEFVGELPIGPRDLVLLVDYFGINERAVQRQLSRLPKSRVVVDCSQAYFQGPFDCLATIYSPRKFIPVADGGYISTDLALYNETSDENSSIERYDYLLRRVGAEPEFSRDRYLQAEESLKRVTLRSMSLFSRNLVASVDQAFIVARRATNFKSLSVLSEINDLSFQVENQIPLCYPLMVRNATVLREKLKEKRIFTPRYWPNVVPVGTFERSLLEDTIYLPIDHRYGDNQMRYIAELVMRFND